MRGYADPVAQAEIDKLRQRMAEVQADNAQAYVDGESSGYADWHCAFSEWTDAGDDIDTPQAAVWYVTRLEAERDSLRLEVARLRG